MTISNYKVHKLWVKEAEFEVLVLEIPEIEIEDKLAYFARDKGNINRSFYEDFVIATCVANINQLLFHIKQQVLLHPNLMNIRSEIMGGILEINPLFKPDNLVINRNSVVKLKGKKGPKDGERLLIENKSWDLSYYEEVMKNQPQLELPPGSVDPTQPAVPTNNEVPKKSVTTKPLNELEYVIVKKWWKRINRYVEIKQFKEEDMGSILKQRFFHNRSSFQTFIVSVCVIDSDDLLTMLDNMGIPSRVAPPILMHEIYELCREDNKFLTYENAQKFTEGLENDENDTPQSDVNRNTPNRMASHARQQNTKKKKPKKVFKDVPKEDLLKLSDNMKVFLIGQDQAITDIAEAVQRASVGLKDPVRPIGSFLFAGRTGIGKTLAAKVLADELIKDRDNLITIDCSEYSADHEYAKLIGCFVPGTKVLMEDGSRKKIENINIGDKVVTHKGRSRKVEFVHEYSQDGEMLEVTAVNSNLPEIMTKTHEILAIKSSKCTRIHRKHVTCKPTCSSNDCSTKLFNNYELEWAAAKDLKVGDVVAYPRYKPTGEYPESIDLASYVDEFTRYKYDDESVWAQKHVKIPRYIKVNEDLTRLAGYFVSEGGCSKSEKTINFTFHSKEHDYIVEVVKLIRRIFGGDVRIRIKDRVGENNTYRIYVSSRLICRVMSDLFGQNTYVKKVPVWFKDMPDDLLKGFLETAVFGDGCQVIPRRMDYSTVSETLHSQMELFFRRLGYITATSLEKKSKIVPNCKDRYRLYIGGSQIEKLNTEFNFNIDLSDLRLTSIQRMAWLDDDYVYKQIKKINTIKYVGKVYDLTVEEDVSYVIDFIVHNSPQGYIGFEQGGYLTNAVMKSPFSVVVFDEVEKASTKVHELLLQILEEGRLTDGKGQQVSFKDTIVIMTSNVGVGEVDAISKTIGFGDVAKITDAKKDKAIDEAIKGKFKPEFINRIDSIIKFKGLSKDDYMRIIDIELYKLNDNLKNNDTEYKGLTLKFDSKIKKLIYDLGINEAFGARPLKRCIEKEVATPIAMRLLKENTDPDSLVTVSVRNKKVSFKINKKPEALFVSDTHKEMATLSSELQQ